MKNNMFIRAWRGELHQALAFWLLFFVIIAALLVVSSLMSPNYFSIYVYNVVVALYSIYAALCVIRCGRKYRKEAMSNLKGFKLNTLLFISCLYNFLAGLCVYLIVLNTASHF